GGAVAAVPPREVLDDRQEGEHQVLAQEGATRVDGRQRRELPQVHHLVGVLAGRSGGDGLDTHSRNSRNGHRRPRDERRGRPVWARGRASTATCTSTYAGCAEPASRTAAAGGSTATAGRGSH